MKFLFLNKEKVLIFSIRKKLIIYDVKEKKRTLKITLSWSLNYFKVETNEKLLQALECGIQTKVI